MGATRPSLEPLLGKWMERATIRARKIRRVPPFVGDGPTNLPSFYPKPRPFTPQEQELYHLREKVAQDVLGGLYEGLEPYHSEW